MPVASEAGRPAAGGRFSRHDLDKASALLEIDDLERYWDRG
ncbi:MAG: hypothetical protein OXG35_06210 [Acidobacteria bacterium]|nr:hypothetical protein [Acidobacteriota bacterium]